jgi:hypothetical protein
MQMTTGSASVRHPASTGRLLVAAWLACVVPAAADAPVRDTRTWAEGSAAEVTFSVPETYGDCAPRDLADTIYTDGVPTSWRLAGQVNVGFVRDGVFTILRVLPVDTYGDLAMTVEYPPHSEVLSHSNGVLEYHVEPQIEVYNSAGGKTLLIGGDIERAPGTLGPGGQDWDVFCATTLTSSTRR